MALSWRREEPGSIHAIAGNGGSRERRTTLLLGILLACLAASLLVGCSGSAPDGEGAQASARPNVVFILADDIRADDFEYMPRTRQLLAEEGLAFDNAFVAHSLLPVARFDTEGAVHAQPPSADERAAGGGRVRKVPLDGARGLDRHHLAQG